MNVNDVYEIIKYATNKAQSGYITPANFNLIINQASRSFQDYLLGEFQQYQYQRPVARVEFGQNQVVRQRLTPTIYNYILSVDSTGFSPYPGDYQQTDAILSMYGFNRVRYVQQDSLYSYYNSTIDPIASNPIYLIEELGFRFYPETINQARLSYVRTVPEIEWAYTVDGQGRPVYDPINSKDPVWLELDIYEVIARALKLVGVNLQARDVSALAQDIVKGGQ